MATAIPGGQYKTANGRWVNAHGEPIDPPQKTKSKAPKATPPQGDDLTVIVGIGQTMQERLNLAGINTFAELVTAEIGQIAAATRANESIIKAWQGDALALSEQQKETEGEEEGEEGDDLTLIDGIGPARSQELALKNVTSFQALAQADPEWLHATMEVSRATIDEWQAEAGRLASS